MRTTVLCVVNVGAEGSGPPLPSWGSQVAAALLLAVVVELVLPVHHVGRPAVELHLPLPLCLVDVVWRQDRGNHRQQLVSTS